MHDAMGVEASSFMLTGDGLRGENVEDAFLETAKQIYQNIQDGRCVAVARAGLGAHDTHWFVCVGAPSLDLNVAESGVQQKQATGTVAMNEKGPAKQGGCC